MKDGIPDVIHDCLAVLNTRGTLSPLPPPHPPCSQKPLTIHSTGRRPVTS